MVEPHVCIIGAGSSGITAAQVMQARGVAFDCFEAGSDIGGNWRYENDNAMSSAYESLGSEESDDVDRQLYMGEDGRVRFGVGSNKTALSSGTAINDGNWHHVVGTYTSGNNGMKLYVDGQLQGQTKASVTNFKGYWRAGAEEIDFWPGNPGDFFQGTLDELAVYTYELTATQVAAHYHAAGY